MDEREIFITSVDHARLKALLRSPSLMEGPDRERLAELRNEVNRAVIVEPEKMPPDVVTMQLEDPGPRPRHG